MMNKEKIEQDGLKFGHCFVFKDCNSLGMVIWEIADKCTIPFKSLDNNLAMFKIFSNGKENIPVDTPQNIREIIQQRWKDNPNEQITLKSILEKNTYAYMEQKV
jgi:hypothetical protein